ncbi:MAG: hypothetical protein NTX04_08535 [Verrucomicrobia bacterium]|nr:hypothetical protein [Verrucomicrobiota bacterium]
MATDIGGEVAEKIEVAVAGEEAEVKGETGCLAIAEAAIDVWEGAFDEVLEIGPNGGACFAWVYEYRRNSASSASSLALL